MLAVVATVVAVGLYGGRYLGESGDAFVAKPKTFTTKAGQRADIRLTDGSQVRLNVNSRLTLLSSFGSGQREVRLEGEAFFEVKSDSTRPFVVHTGDATTRVLGTAFDVNAYIGDEKTQVVVKEGRVAMSVVKQPEAGTPQNTGRQPRSSRQQPVVLTKGQMGKVFRSGEQVVSEGVSLDSYLAWMDGQLVFENASFEEVTRKIRRWYGVDIALRDSASTVPPGHLNARFSKKQSLGEVLGVVATAFGLEHERSDGKRAVFFDSAMPTSMPAGGQ